MKKIIPLVIFTVALSLGIAYAANVTVSEDVTVYVPSAGRYFTLQSTSNALDTIQVTDTTIVVTTDLSTGTVRIHSAEGLDMGLTHNSLNQALYSCGQTGSLLIIQANTTAAVTITITPPTTGTLICSTSTSTPSTGTGGTGGGGGGTGSVTPPPVTPPVTPPATGLRFNDIGKLQTATQSKINEVIDLMLAKKTFKLPINNKFKPNIKTNRTFAIQTALAVGDQSCAKTSINFTNCVAAARTNEIIGTALPTTYPTRCEIYEMLLKASDIPMLDRSAITKDDLPADITSVNAKCAPIYVTAKLYGIATEYSGNKSNYRSSVSRYLSLLLAQRALNAKKLMAEGALPKNVTIQLTATGWLPSAVVVNLGDTVTFVNKTTGKFWPMTADGTLAKLDAKKELKAGSKYSLIFDQSGIWAFHDHLKQELTGTVTVTGEEAAQ